MRCSGILAFGGYAACEPLFGFDGIEKHREEAALLLDLDNVVDRDCIGLASFATILRDDFNVGVFDHCGVNVIGMGRRGVVDAGIEITDNKRIPGLGDETRYVFKKSPFWPRHGRWQRQILRAIAQTVAAHFSKVCSLRPLGTVKGMSFDKF